MEYLDDDEISKKIDDLINSIKISLNSVHFVVKSEGNIVLINFQNKLICGIKVERLTYKIFNVSSNWKEKTTYLSILEDNGTYSYYLDTIDECIGEVKRLADFEAKDLLLNIKHTSELSNTITIDVFKNAFVRFIEQADKNAISKKAEGSKIPYGFSEIPNCDGAGFGLKYGSGTASAAPYINWWVVSIYYLPSNGRIIVGIQKDLYIHLEDMQIKPIKFENIGNKTVDIAAYYYTSKEDVNYSDLYENFVTVCEEVMRLGLD